MTDLLHNDECVRTGTCGTSCPRAIASKFPVGSKVRCVCCPDHEMGRVAAPPYVDSWSGRLHVPVLVAGIQQSFDARLLAGIEE